MPGPYSAGSIFISVVPSFKDNQRDIAREYQRRGEEASKTFSEGFDKQIAKDLPKAMERAARQSEPAQAKAGDEAGEAYSSAFRKTLGNGIKAAQRELERLDVKVPIDMDRDKFINQVNALKRDINLTEADLRVGADVRGALSEIDRVIGAMRRLQAVSNDPEFRTGLGSAVGPIEDAAKRVRSQAALNPEGPPQQVERQGGAFEAGLRNRLQAGLRALPPVEITADPTPAMRKIIEFRQDAFRLLDDLEADVELDADDTLARARALMVLLEGVIETADPEVEIDSSFNAAGALAQIKGWTEAVDPIEIPIEPEMGFFRQKVVQSLRTAGEALPEIRIGADTTDVQREMADVRARLLQLSEDVKLGLDLDEARRESAELQIILARLRATEIDIEVDVDAARAIAELEALDSVADDVDRSLRRSARGADDGANSFRAFSGRVLAVAALGPVAIPVLGALAVSLMALGPLAIAGGAALGVFALGVMGVGEAVKAMGDAERNAAKDAKAYADGVRNAARSLQSAEQGVASARRQAADSAVQSRERVARATDRVTDAEEDLRDAQRDAQRAQEGLTQAREDYAERMLDLELAARGGALAERRAYMQLAEAEIAYANALVDPGATRTEREQLLLDLDEQKLRVDQVALSNRRLSDEQAEAARTGVEGSDEVVSAQQRIEQANQRVADAQESVADAVADVARAQADSQRAAADSARAITDAQLRLADAQADYADAVAATSASQDKLAESMAKLSPAGRAFAEYLYSLKPFFAELRGVAAAGLLPGVQEWMQDIIGTHGPQLTAIVGNISGAFGDMFRGWGEALKGEAWSGFFDMLEQRGATFVTQIGDTLTALGNGFASLMTAFAPAAEDFGNGMVGMAQRFEAWAAGLAQTQGFREFMEWWERVGPKVVDFFYALGAAIVAIGVALAPYAEDLMEVFTSILNWISETDPQALGAIAVGIMGVVLAFQLLVGLNALILGFRAAALLASAASALFSGTAVGFGAVMAGIAGAIAIAVAAIAVFGVAIYLLWQNSETFRDIVKGAWEGIQAAVAFVVDWFQTHVMPVMMTVLGAIGDFFTWLWREIIEPIFNVWQVVWGVLWDFMVAVWNNFGRPMFELIWGIVQQLWDIIGPIFELIGIGFQALWYFAKALWDGIGKPIFDAWVAITLWLWEKVLDPVLGWIADGFGVLFGFIKSVWDTIGEPVLRFFGEVVEGLVGIFQGSFDGIKGIWEALLDILMAPIVFVVETVLNKGLIAGINWIAGIFTDDKTWIDPIPTDWIPGRAMGGEIPGTSPHKRADNVLIRATAGEFMHEVDTVDYYGVGMMDAINKRLIPREALMAGLQGRAYGGLIDPMWGAVKAQFPNARLTSHYRPGDPGFHGRKQAIDIGGSRPMAMQEMLAINRWIAANFGSGAAELIHTQPGAVNLYRGKPHTYGAATRGDHMDHVHWAMTMMKGVFNAVMGGGGDEQSIWGKLSDFLSGPGNFLQGIVTKWAGDSGKTPIGNMLLNIPRTLATNAVDPLMDLVNLAGNALENIGAGWNVVTGDTNVLRGRALTGPVQDQVRGVAARYGWDSGNQWGALVRLIEKESSWNPNAANPTSSARGLFQKMTSIHGPVERTAAGQAEWGLKYVADRYGDPIRALAFHNRNNWYGHGGLIEAMSTPTLHDDGGVIDPGWNLLYNATGKPEASLNPQQLDNIQRIADSGGRGSAIGQLHLHEVGGMHEAIGEVNHWAAVYDQGGRYDPTGG